MDYRLDPPDAHEDEAADPDCGLCGGTGRISDEDEARPRLMACPCTSLEWQRRRDMVRAKHERGGGPDEQQLADMGRTS